MIDAVNTKSFFASKTVWAGIAAGVAGAIQTAVAVAGATGHPVDPATAQVAGTIAGQVVSTAAQAATSGFTPDQLVQLGTGIVGALGGVGAIVGRFVATKKIG